VTRFPVGRTAVSAVLTWLGAPVPVALVPLFAMLTCYRFMTRTS
jgi:hypothetical protein